MSQLNAFSVYLTRPFLFDLTINIILIFQVVAMELLVMPVGAAALPALLPRVEGCGRGHGAAAASGAAGDARGRSRFAHQAANRRAGASAVT